MADRVKGPGGVEVAVYEWGTPSGPPIVFIHGFCQSALAFAHLRDLPIARQCRLIAYDLRGHGDSEKPLAPEAYRDGAAWGDELAAVLAAKDVRQPVIVAWSYGGGIVGEYLSRHGGAGVAGLNLVGAATCVAPQWFGPARVHVPGMLGADLEQRIAATRAFTRAMHHRPLEPAALETTLAWQMVVPVEVRRAMTGRPFDIQRTLQALDMPVLVTHGEHDAVILPEMARWSAATIPGATLSWYADAGHTAFTDDAPRFAAELQALVERAQQR